MHINSRILFASFLPFRVWVNVRRDPNLDPSPHKVNDDECQNILVKHVSKARRTGGSSIARKQKPSQVPDAHVNLIPS